MVVQIHRQAHCELHALNTYQHALNTFQHDILLPFAESAELDVRAVLSHSLEYGQLSSYEDIRLCKVCASALGVHTAAQTTVFGSCSHGQHAVFAGAQHHWAQGDCCDHSVDFALNLCQTTEHFVPHRESV